MNDSDSDGAEADGAGAADSEGLALAALQWLEATATADGDGVWWSAKPSSDEPDPTLYQGTAGIILGLLEADAHFGGGRWGELAARGTRWLADELDRLDTASYPALYVGTAGTAFALHEAAGRLGAADADRDVADVARAAAMRGLAGVRAAFDGERWGDAYELMFGNAGIGLAALRLGDPELAEAAVTPYLRSAETTAFGQTWEQRRGQPARRHHISHGTLGIAYALAVIGTAVGRRDLVDAALAGVADVVARDEAGPDGFLVPHSDPQQVVPGLERYSYGWCHGPAGDAQVFRLLAQLADGARDAGATGAASGDDWRTLADRCWRTVTTSGLPARLRPGFWDNSGRCCGTGGVLALACDRAVEDGDGLECADLLVADLARRAIVDVSGARWSNIEYRARPPELEPRPGWAMGNAGLIRELLRHARITTGRDPGYAVQWIDHPAAVAAAPGWPRANDEWVSAMAKQAELIYKILSVADWEAARRAGRFEGSADDRRDGFIHFSDGATVIGTARKYFAGQSGLVLLAVDPARLADLRWERSRDDALFPHLYGPLELDAVSRADRLNDGLPVADAIADLLPR